MRANGRPKINSSEAQAQPHKLKARLTREGLDLDVESANSRMIFAIVALLIGGGVGVIACIACLVIRILS